MYRVIHFCVVLRMFLLLTMFNFYNLDITSLGDMRRASFYGQTKKNLLEALYKNYESTKGLQHLGWFSLRHSSTDYKIDAYNALPINITTKDDLKTFISI